MRHAVIHPNKGLVPQLRQHSYGGSAYLERGAHAGALGVANAVDVGGGDAGFVKRGAKQAGEILEVMLGRLAGEEAVAGRGDVGGARVCEDVAV